MAAGTWHMWEMRTQAFATNFASMTKIDVADRGRTSAFGAYILERIAIQPETEKPRDTKVRFKQRESEIFTVAVENRPPVTSLAHKIRAG
jgi:hypothetical protein